MNNYIVALSKYTKTIALHRIKNDINEIKDNNSQDIEIFSASANLITSINWNNHVNGRIIDMKWTLDEKLCVLLQNGLVRVYYDFEGNFNEYEVGYDAALVGVRAFTVFENLILVMLNDYKIIYIDLDNEISVNAKLFKDIQQELGNEQIHFWNWAVLPQGNKKIEVLISINKEVYLVPKYGKPVKTSIDGPFQSIHISENHEFIALFQEHSRKIYIVSANFQKALFDFKLESIPNQIKWCGSDAVAVSYNDYVKLIAPGGSLDFYLNSDFRIETEVDGLTILTDSTIEFLSKVNNDTVDCFKIGSTSKSSILIDSIDKLNKHSPKANENLKIIGSDENLNQAVQTCIRASFEEFDPYWQKKLLKSASFGKSALELSSQSYKNNEKFVEACDQLRILNSIRSSDIGIFLTFTEFEKLGIEKIIKLLVKRQQFYQSFQIAQFLKLPIDLIFIDWACCKIKYNPNLNDEELSQSIITKFQSISNKSYISFEKISTIAFQEGRLNLAKILINFESLFTKQIPLLLTMEEHELALKKAVDSQDVDLLLEILLTLQETLSLPNFFKLLNNSKIASNCFEYFNHQNKKLIHDYINQADRLIDMANFEIDHYIIHDQKHDELDDQFGKKISVLQNSLDAYNLMRKNSNDTRQIEKQLKLVKLQETYTNDFNIDFTNLSIVGTLEKLILLNQNNKIAQFVKEFKISDKKFYHVKLNFLTKENKFDEMYEWSNAKKPPIGYEPFIKAAQSKGELQLALKFLSKTSLSYSQRVDYLIKLQDFKTIIDEASHKKDLATLERIEPMITTPRLKQLLEENKSKFSGASASSTRFF